MPTKGSAIAVADRERQLRIQALPVMQDVGANPETRARSSAFARREDRATIKFFVEGVSAMRYLHTMLRVRNLDASLRFYCEGLGLVETRRKEVPQGRFTLVFLAAPESPEAEIELTFNWPAADGAVEDYGSARNFGHLAFRVDDIHATCAHLMAMGVTINRPPRDGHMAFVRSPDLISIELLQEGEPLPPAEPWASMPNSGSW